MVIASCGNLPFNYTISEVNIMLDVIINKVHSTISVVPENNRIQTIGQNSNAKEDTDYVAIRPLLTNLIKSYLPQVSQNTTMNLNTINPNDQNTYNLNAFAMMVIVKLGTALLDNVTILNVMESPH